MKIAQINLGLIEIPPKSWGAIEKVIWNYKLELEKMGHQCDIVYPWQLFADGKLQYDIVHFHAANQAIETWDDHQIPYVFSTHDHHVVRYGKNSPLFSKNLSAMKHSVASITYAEFLVDYFDTTDKLFYIPHGVDNSIYFDKNIPFTKHKLLCVANNGYADDSKSDRKGFRYAIEAANEIGLDITIVGPENNMNFFNANEDLLKSPRLTIIKNPSESELIDIYNEHTIFLHLSELEAGHPNLTLVEAMACGLPIVGTYEGKKQLPGLIKASRNTKDVVNKIIDLIQNYDFHKKSALETAKKHDWSNIVKELLDFYTFVCSVNNNFTKEDVKERVLNAYRNSQISKKEPIEPKMKYNINFNDGAFVEMICPVKKEIKVDFIDKNTNNVVYWINMESNRWAKTNTKYYKDWKIVISGDDNQVIENDFKGKNVLLEFHSSSLGDSLAWVPYAEEFRLKHNCIVYCSTHNNSLYDKEYPKIIFIKPGTAVDNIYATYKFGWFSPPWGGNRDVHPNDYRLIPLQQTATDILGLPYKEIRPKVTIPDEPRPIKEKYVVIAEHSTSDAKHWHYPNGWQIIVDWLKSQGLEVMVISKQATSLKGVKNETGNFSLEKRINQIKHSEFMISIGSGLSWLAWAIGKKVVMISGFSKPFCEFQENCIRVHNDKVCNGCFNDTRYEFDRGDWMWCPAHKGTPRHFECTKTITPGMVMESIKNNNLI